MYRRVFVLLSARSFSVSSCTASVYQSTSKSSTYVEELSFEQSPLFYTRRFNSGVSTPGAGAQSGSVSGAAPERTELVQSALNDIHSLASGSGGLISMQRIVLNVSPQTKNVIFKSGLGVEKFIRSAPDFFAVEVRGSEKMIRAKPLLNSTAPGCASTASHTSKPTFVDPSQAAKRLARQEQAKYTGVTPPPISGSALPTVTSVANTSSSQELDSATAPKGDSTGKNFVMPDPAAPGADLIKLIYSFLQPGQYYAINEVHSKIYRTDAQKQLCSFKDFDSFVRASPNHFWTASNGLFAPRCIGEVTPPAWQATPAAQSTVPPSAASVASSKDSELLPPLPHRDCGGWSDPKFVPTAEDVFEILRYVPIEWRNLGDLNIPADVKKKHCRIRSFLEWIRRQPQHFDVRVHRGTLEVRRSVLLHPEAHGLTKEQAAAIVEEKVRALNMQVTPTRPATSPTPAAPAAAPASTPAATTSEAPAQSSPPAEPTTPTANAWRSKTGPPTEDELWMRFLNRVTPAYYVTVEQILKRAPKKGAWHASELIEQVKIAPTQFDLMQLSTGVPLVRKRSGVDSAKWMKPFLADLDKAIAAGEIDALLALMTKSCCLWDRTHFLYVRLTDTEKSAVQGHDGMVSLMKRYPEIFKVGEYFYRRVDASDPVRDTADVEPLSGDLTASVRLVDENPYHSSAELAAVFLYLTPERESTTLPYYIECCSPAMRSVLPPRVVTVFQAYPNLFTCKEIAPGSFAIARVNPTA
jgi:hypothetical protein